MKNSKLKKKTINSSNYNAKEIYAKLGAGFASGFISAFFIGCILYFINAFPTIVEKFGAKNEFVAFSIHMLAGIIMAIIFSFVCYNRITSLRASIIYASVFSLVSWLFATVIVKPIRFGGTVLEALIDVLQSLNVFFGHIMFGIALGIAFFYFKKIIEDKLNIKHK